MYAHITWTAAAGYSWASVQWVSPSGNYYAYASVSVTSDAAGNFSETSNVDFYQYAEPGCWTVDYVHVGDDNGNAYYYYEYNSYDSYYCYYDSSSGRCLDIDPPCINVTSRIFDNRPPVVRSITAASDDFYDDVYGYGLAGTAMSDAVDVTDGSADVRVRMTWSDASCDWSHVQVTWTSPSGAKSEYANFYSYCDSTYDSTAGR